VGRRPTGSDEVAATNVRTRVTQSALVRIAATAVFGTALWGANVAVCPGCSAHAVTLPVALGAVRGVLFVPPHRSGPLPVVIVSHGFLASGAFMHVPWAADITHLGAAALVLDRWGHGTSDGTWWPAADRPEIRTAADLAPDLSAALAHLRGLAPRIDPWRIALLGHSDGGTASLLAGSADWDVRATVALSPSAAPWEFLNHVAPRNLLLMFGGDDDLVPTASRALMIGAATRGYLAGPGEYGVSARGTARALRTVPAAGHVGVLYADIARRDALLWIARALALPEPGPLSPLRFAWIWLGLLALQVAYWWPRDAPAAPTCPRRAGTRGAWQRGSAVLGAWSLGLLCAPLWAGLTRALPAQETGAVGAVLASTTATLAAVLCAFVWRGDRGAVLAAANGGPIAVGPGAWSGVRFALSMAAAIHLLIWHLIACPFDRSRLAMWGLFAVLSLPLFALLDATVVRATPSWTLRAALGLVAAASLALAAPWLSLRMGVVPIYLLSATLVPIALSMAGHVSAAWGTVGRACFGALIFGRAIAVTCPLF